MVSLSVSFPSSDTFESLLLLVEVTPFDVLIGVKDSEQDLMNYESINPLPYQSLESLIQNFLDRHPELKSVSSAIIALSSLLLDNPQETTAQGPYHLWIFNADSFKRTLGFSKVIFIDRTEAITRALPFLGPQDLLPLSGKTGSYFPGIKTRSMLALIDQSYDNMLLEYDDLSKKWQETKSFANSLKVETHHMELQHILNIMSQNMPFPFPTLDFFFSEEGLERLYQTLYQEKGMEEYLKREVLESPVVLEKGAPTAVDSLELNDPITRSSLEGVDISIASREPGLIPRPHKMASFLPLPVKAELPSGVSNTLNWDLLQNLPFLTILREALSFKGFSVQPSLDSSAISVPQEIQKLCFECLDMWLGLLGETLGRQALMLNTLGGVFLAGRLLCLMKGFFKDLSLYSSYAKEIGSNPLFADIPFLLVTHPVAAFLGMVSFVDELQ